MSALGASDGTTGDMFGDIEALVARSRHIVLITLVNQGYMDFPRFVLGLVKDGTLEDSPCGWQPWRSVRCDRIV